MPLHWEHVESEGAGSYVKRAKIFGGWLVMVYEDVQTQRPDGYGHFENSAGYEWRPALTFVPDAHHEWVIPFKPGK